MADADAESSRQSRFDELARSAELRLRHLGTRTRVAARTLTVRQSARARVAPLRARVARLELEREDALHDLGAAVYAGDAAETGSAHARVAALDASIATLEDEMQAAVADADAQVAALDAQMRPTVAVTRPADPEQQGPASSG
jgi:hypothetical protein